jgi:3-oxoacyl-[acyl-carrier protein] reductase
MSGERSEGRVDTLMPLSDGASAPIDLRHRVAIVTGAGRGIGRAIAAALASAGASVVLADVEAPEDAVKAIRVAGGTAYAIQADVTVRSQVADAVSRAVADLGRIDILVNNAGVIERTSLEELDEETLQRELDIILKGTVLFTQAAYEVMKAQGGGKIVNIASISGKAGGAVSREAGATSGRSGPAYASAKGAVIAFTKWVAKDGGRHGIQVNAICPGAVDTVMTQGYDYGVGGQPIARIGHPDDIAQAALFLSSQMSNYVTGQTLNVDGGVRMD